MKYEYMKKELNGDLDIDTLNQFGGEGWLLVSRYQLDKFLCPTCVFAREVVEDKFKAIQGDEAVARNLSEL